MIDRSNPEYSRASSVPHPTNSPVPTALVTACRDLDRRAGVSGRAIAATANRNGSVVLDRTDPALFRLAIGVLGAYPSVGECANIAAMCHVPEGIRRHFRQKDQYYVIEYIWNPQTGEQERAATVQPPLDLELAPNRQIEAPDDAPIEERFRLFHAANPQVYAALRALALPLARAGRKRLGMKMLWENLRYQYALATAGDEYKLNNNYTSRYARLLMQQEPELRDLFETRDLRA